MPRNIIATSIFVLLLSALLRCSALPDFWYNSAVRPSSAEYPFEKEPTCVEHPVGSWAHGPPETDRNITFTFNDPITGVISDALCPGGQYAIRLSFDEDRLALLTADPSNSTSFSNPAPTPGCPNRVSFSDPQGVFDKTLLSLRSAFNATFTLPCSSAGSSILFKATSVGSLGRWLQNSITVDVASLEAARGNACAAKSAECLAASSNEGGQVSAAPVALPLPSPSPPLASSPPPLYPSPPSPAPPRSPSPPRPPLLSACVPSPLGYECMITQGKVTIHWSLNTPSAPPNECTPESKTVLQSADLAASGSLHMAVQSQLPGYVALGFGTATGRMAPADIILGWPGDGGSTVPYMNTFYVNRSSLREENVNPPVGTPSWAYDRSIVRNATSGLTTLCFSRRLKDDRAKAAGDLKLVGATSSGRHLLQEARESAVPVPLIWAVSNLTALRKHDSDNRKSFWLNLASSKAASLVSESPLPSQPSAALIVPAETPSPPPANPASNCTPSSLGYQCMLVEGKVTFHWSLNTPSAPPNECTPDTKTVLQSEELATNGSLHVAVQASVQGYVGLGFSNDPDKMAPADIALGWAGETGSDAFFNTFHVMEEDLDESNIHPEPGTQSWAYDRGVVRNATSRITTICFSRRLKDNRALESGNLKEVLAAASAGGRSSESQKSSRRLAHENHVTLSDPDETEEGATGKLGFIWAVSDQKAFVEHLGYNVGGFWLDPASGSTAQPEGRGKRYWINVHGALMAVAWGLLLPLGTMFPAHRWLMGGRKVFGQQLWFVAHLTTQWTGMILFIAGFIVAFTKLEGGGSGDVKEAHESIGIAIMAAAGAQVVLAFVRPAPPSPGETMSNLRRVWNLVHHNLGRAVVLLAWANVYIGIYVYHTSMWAASYTPWVTPIAIVMGLLVIADVALRIAATRAISEYDVSKQMDFTAIKGSSTGGPTPAPVTGQPEEALKAQST